jgi:hypothetical protein
MTEQSENNRNDVKPMRRSRLWILLLAIVTLGVDYLAARFVPTPSSAFDLTTAQAAHKGLVAAQVGLLAVWVGLDGMMLPWRIAGMLGGLVLIYKIGIASELHSWLLQPEIVALIYFLLAIPLIAALLALRIAGVGLAQGWDQTQSERPAERRPRTQFSLRFLFGWTAGLAVLLSALRYFGPYEETFARAASVWRDCEAMPLAGLVPLAAVWAVLGRRWWPVRWTLFALAASGVAWWSIHRMFSELARYQVATDLLQELWVETVVSSCAAQAVWLVASLLVVRLAGYRLTWRESVLL